VAVTDVDNTYKIKLKPIVQANDGPLYENRWCGAGKRGGHKVVRWTLREDLLAGRVVPLMPD